MNNNTNRLRELDFLRGIAILLVLVRHIPFSYFTTQIGWVGVDLFFVLSGFLVSGLLFKEYIKFGNVKPMRFLIRRGFKIYPIYYLFYIPYLLMKIWDGRFYWIGFLSDMTFTQNFIISWGWAFAASWSLAVEEHFYFALALLLPIAFSKGLVAQKANSKKMVSLPSVIAMIMAGIILLRLLCNILLVSNQVKLFTNTQYRIDSLLAGVLVAYGYYFKRQALESWFVSNKKWLYVAAVLLVLWLPFFDAVDSFFVRVIGFTLLYISAAIVLMAFLFSQHINATLNKFFTPWLANAISKVGFCSYSIYIIHTLIINICERLMEPGKWPFLICAFTGSIAAGMLMTFFVEKYFLGLRDRYYPARA